MPLIPDAPTYKVSVSGSMAPLDYIAANGEPTGYSIAFLSKVSEITNLNFEFVIVGIGADRMELMANKIDFIFCYTISDEILFRITELVSDLVISDPYYIYESSVFLVNK